MNNRRVTAMYTLLMLWLVGTHAFQKPNNLLRKKQISTTRLNMALPTSTKPNTKRKNAMKHPNPLGSPLIQVDHHVEVIDVHETEIVSSEPFSIPVDMDDHPFGPKTKLGHHLVDGLFIDSLLLRNAPFESGHFTPFQAPPVSVQQHVDTFATTLKSLRVPESVSVTLKPIASTLPGFMPLPGTSFFRFLLYVADYFSFVFTSNLQTLCQF